MNQLERSAKALSTVMCLPKYDEGPKPTLSSNGMPILDSHMFGRPGGPNAEALVVPKPKPRTEIVKGVASFILNAYIGLYNRRGPYGTLFRTTFR